VSIFAFQPLIVSFLIFFLLQTRLSIGRHKGSNYPVRWWVPPRNRNCIQTRCSPRARQGCCGPKDDGSPCFCQFHSSCWGQHSDICTSFGFICSRIPRRDCMEQSTRGGLKSDISTLKSCLILFFPFDFRGKFHWLSLLRVQMPCQRFSV
jgi:hypothetical protein